MIYKFNRGDIYRHDFGSTPNKHITYKKRPCVIISSDKGNHNTMSPIVNVAPLSSRNELPGKPYHVTFKVNDLNEVVMLEQIQTVNKDDLCDYMGRVDTITMKQIDLALGVTLDLNLANEELFTLAFLERLDKTLNSLLTVKLDAINNVVTDVEYILKKINNLRWSTQDSVNLSLLTSAMNFKSINEKPVQVSTTMYKSSIEQKRQLIEIYEYHLNNNTLHELIENMKTTKQGLYQKYYTAKRYISKYDSENTDNEVIEPNNIETNNTSKIDVNNVSNIRKEITTLDDAKQFVEYYNTHTSTETMKFYNFHNTKKVYNTLQKIRKIYAKYDVDYNIKRHKRKCNKYE